MRTILSATALSAILALAAPAFAQTGSTGSPGATGGATGSSTAPGGAQMQGRTPGSPLPMTQPSPGTMSDSQRPSTAAGAMGSTSANPQGTAPGMGQQGGPAGGTSGTQSMTMDETQVRDLLRSQGYGEVQSITRDGDNFRARVSRNGRPADISIDAYTGTIRNQAARR